eukprot:gene44240-66669_t
MRFYQCAIEQCDSIQSSEASEPDAIEMVRSIRVDVPAAAAAAGAEYELVAAGRQF